MFQYSCSQTIQELTLNDIYIQGFNESKVLAVPQLSPLSPTTGKADHIESLDLLRSKGGEKDLSPEDQRLPAEILSSPWETMSTFINFYALLCW